VLAHANPDLSPRMDAAGRAGLYRLRKSSMALGVGTVSTTPARHPSSSEEGSIFNNSPPDSGGVAPWAPGWLSAEDSFSAACSAPPFQTRGEKSRLAPHGLQSVGLGGRSGTI
jgi:hypothetical protein